jgi:hypothetical protein
VGEVLLNQGGNILISGQTSLGFVALSILLSPRYGYASFYMSTDCAWLYAGMHWIVDPMVLGEDSVAYKEGVDEQELASDFQTRWKFSLLIIFLVWNRFLAVLYLQSDSSASLGDPQTIWPEMENPLLSLDHWLLDLNALVVSSLLCPFSPLHAPQSTHTQGGLKKLVKHRVLRWFKKACEA